jgi:hypothetical protein
MDVDTSRASQREASKSVEPLNRAFDDPAVAVEALFGFDAAASDSLCDAAPPEHRTAAVVVVALVGVKLRRSASKVASRREQRGGAISLRMSSRRTAGNVRRSGTAG